MTRFVQALLDLLKRWFRREGVSPAPLPELPSVATPAHPDGEVTDPGAPLEPDETQPVAPPSVEQDEDSPMTRPTLSRGTADRAVALELQILLNKNGAGIGADGAFGPGTEKALKAFQQSYGLPVTGTADAATWAILDRGPYNSDLAYGGVPLPATKSVAGTSGVAKAWNGYGNLLTMLSSALDISPATACAVLAVESAGQGFWGDKMVIRFENHIFQTYWGKANPETFSKHFRMNSDKRWTGHAWRAGLGDWMELHTKTSGQAAEWAVLVFARSLDDTAALKSISMGAPQIMGFNSELVGFNTVQAMFKAFSTDERAHVLGLFDFCRSNHKMVRALRTGDWKGFAYIYNGTGQATYYGQKIGENVVAAKKLGIA